MTAASPASLRRGWCPSTLRPMETGDGWLVRLHPPQACLTPPQLIAVAALAERFGNGLIEITARANLQLRGISAAAHPELVAALLRERLVDEVAGEGPQRLVLTSPLLDERPGFPGLDFGDFVDAAALARDLAAAGRELAGLPPKCAIVVDGGGSLALDGVAADLRLVGVAPGLVSLGLPHGLWYGPLAPDAALTAALALLRGFAAMRRDRPELRRLRDCTLASLAAMIAAPRCAAPAPRPAPARAGLFTATDGRCAAMVALPFGRCGAGVLRRLGEAAGAGGAKTLRLTPWRGLSCLDLDRAAALRFLDQAQELGLIVADGDPRLGVQACAGRPACARAQSDSMADAAVLADRLAPLLAASLSLHVSGCIKGCAHPGPADLTLVGAEGGYDLVVGGAPRDEPLARLDLAAILARLQPGQDLYSRLARPSGRMP